MRRAIIVFILFSFFISCAGEKDPNYLGYVEKLPPGEYIICNYGSRHMVKCVNKYGKWYMLNDADFEINGIPGYDAHQYRNETKIIIKWKKLLS